MATSVAPWASWVWDTRQKVPFPVLDSERGARQNIFGDFGLRQNIFGDFALRGKYTRDKWICLRRQITYGETNGDKWRQMKIICLLMSPFVSRLSPFVSCSRETNDLTRETNGDKRWRKWMHALCQLAYIILSGWCFRRWFCFHRAMSAEFKFKHRLCRGTCSILYALRVWSCAMSVAP